MTIETAKNFLATRPDWAIERFAKMPMTNFMYLLVGYVTLRTTEHYMRTPNWTPSVEWLGFIVGLTGGAITQWVKKRTTDHQYQRIQQQMPRDTDPTPPRES